MSEQERKSLLEDLEILKELLDIHLHPPPILEGRPKRL
jgi:hypothetical protein